MNSRKSVSRILHSPGPTARGLCWRSLGLFRCRKDALTPLESRLVECAAKGEELDCAPTGATAAELDKIDDWDERKIRAWVLVALCTGEVPDWSVHPRRGLRLRGACITGEVDLSRAQMSQCPLAFDTCRFEEDVVLYQATTSDLNFTSCALPSLFGEELTSSASLHLTETQLREMSLLRATFRGVVELSEVRLINSEGVALMADGMSASVVFLENIRVEGEVRLVGANLGGEFGCREGTKLINPGGYALNAQGCRVEGALVFRLGEAAAGGVNLSYAQIGTLNDDLASWPGLLYTYTLEGFSYHSLGGDQDLNRRLRWVTNSKPFSPQVYTQLAEVYRRSGHEGFARQVAIKREKERGQQPDLSLWVRAWRRFLGVTVAYGYEPGRALALFVVLLAVGWLYFAQPSAKQTMIPTRHVIDGPDSAAEVCQNYPCFSPLVYTLDALVPIIVFHQETYWVPAANNPWGRMNLGLTTLLILAGWLLITAIVAGIASLWRRE
jgi:uncharacterized protein YjbI with pentapeptide repeats